MAALAVAAIGIAMERLFLRSEGFAYLRNAVIAFGVGRPHQLGDRPLAAGDRRRAGFSLSPSPRSPPSSLFFVLSRISIVPIDTDVLRQVLLTVGFAFLFQQAALDIWGGNNMDINPPAAFTQSIVIGGIYFPALSRCS